MTDQEETNQQLKHAFIGSTLLVIVSMVLVMVMLSVPEHFSKYTECSKCTTVKGEKK